MENTLDRRLQLMNELLNCPHSDLDKAQIVHANSLKEDPLFYRALSCWYVYGKNGQIRDHEQLFVANLLLHEDEDFRNCGLAMIREMPPFSIEKILNHIHGNYVKELNKVTDKKTGKTRKIATGKIVKKGLGKNIPRSLKTELQRYIEERQSNLDWFDSSVLTARKSMKRICALLHLKLNERSNSILFENNPPEDSKIFYLKELSKTEEPSEQARLIIEHKIPYRVASSIVKTMSPTILLALINSMSSAELINSMSSLKTHGVFDNPELKELVTSKLELAKKDKKVSALKATEAVKVAGLSDDLNDSLNAVANSQIKSKGKITRPTAILIDKSSSMNMAIEVGKQIAALASTCMADEADLYVYAFDTMPVPIETPKDISLAGWTQAFKHIKANGCTSVGAGMVGLKLDKRLVESIVCITDEAENTPPAFLKAYNEYCETMNIKPSVHMIRCGNFTNDISAKLERAGVEISKYDIKSEADYYSLPQIITYLSKPGRLELLMEIMNFPLPERKVPTSETANKKLVSQIS